MSRYTDAMLGGLAGGLVVSAAIAAARQSGWGHAGVSKDEEALPGRPSDALARCDRASAFASAQGSHLLASVGFGQAYAVVRERLPDVPPALLGAAYGALLHAVTTAGLGHAVGIARGEFRAPEGGAVRRLGAHMVFGIVTALATDWIERRRG